MQRINSFSLVARTPGDADLHYMIGHELVQAGRGEEALPWLEKYVAMGRDVGAALGLIASVHAAEDRKDEAREALDRGIRNALACGHPSMAAELRQQLAELDLD